MKATPAGTTLGLMAAAIVFAALPSRLLATTQDEPWSVSVNDPVLLEGTNRAPRSVAQQFERGKSIVSDFGYCWLRFYQEYLAPSGTTKCPMAPSCSVYSMLAISKHGIAIGVVMTADRLIHEADEKRWVKLVGAGSDARYADPIENNDFWWYKR